MKVEDSGSGVVLSMSGDLDLATIGQVMAAVDRIDVARVGLVVLDLRGVEFLDLAGLKAILRSVDYCTEHGVQVTVVKPRGFASRVFTLTRVHLELDLVDAPRPSAGS